MSFQPIVPASGLLGWRLFQQTAPRQQEIFATQDVVLRDIAYFRDNITSVKTADDLVDDRRLLKVALGAFGLEDEINKKALVRRILEEGTEKSDSLANRLNDPRWKEFAEGFGFGNIAGPKTLLTSFRENTITNYIERAFEASVGEVDTDIRLALNFRREIAKIAAGDNVERVGWFQALGQRPLRLVFEAALDLPAAIGAIDVDRQRDVFEEKFAQRFGGASLRDLSNPEVVDDVLRRFFLQSSVASGPSPGARGAAALAILSGPGPSAANLFLSRL